MATTLVKPSAPRSRTGGAYPYYVVLVLAMVALLNTTDQSILSVASPAIQSDFRLSDSQVGLLFSAFVVVYGLAALPLGHWSDRTRRTAVIGAAVAVWSTCTLLTGVAQNYAQLLLARTALGIGEAGSVPATVSLLGDYFTKKNRGRAAGAVQGALQLGLAIGLIAGGVVAGRFGWRSAFYLAALPGLILAALALTLREPQRGSAEPVGRVGRPNEPGMWAAFTRLLRIRSYVAAVLTNTFVLFASTGVGGFIALYATRRFGLGLAQVGAMVGLPLLIGAVAGNAIGGWLVDWRSQRAGRAHLEIAIVACGLCAMGMVATFTASSASQFELAFLLASLAGNLGMPGLLAINQNLVIPPLRGRAAAIQQLASNLVGRALGLSLIGLASDQLHDLRLALMVLAPAALVTAALCATAGLRSMPREVAAMELEWEQVTQPPSQCEILGGRAVVALH